MPVNTGQKQGNRFKPGQSGNPAGKPKGARHKATLAVQALLDNEAETIGRKAVELAKAGDMTAIRLVLERVLPARRDAPLTIDLPDIETAENITAAYTAVAKAVAAGEITPSEGTALSGILESARRAFELGELEERIKQLEEQHGKSR